MSPELLFSSSSSPLRASNGTRVWCFSIYTVVSHILAHWVLQHTVKSAFTFLWFFLMSPSMACRRHWPWPSLRPWVLSTSWLLIINNGRPFLRAPWPHALAQPCLACWGVAALGAAWWELMASPPPPWDISEASTTQSPPSPSEVNPQLVSEVTCSLRHDGTASLFSLSHLSPPLLVFPPITKQVGCVLSCLRL